MTPLRRRRCDGGKWSDAQRRALCAVKQRRGVACSGSGSSGGSLLRRANVDVIRVIQPALVCGLERGWECERRAAAVRQQLPEVETLGG